MRRKKKRTQLPGFGDFYIALGIRISYFRKLRGLSQEQLAERAGISPGFLSQVEAPGMAVGISLSTLFLIAEALEIPPLPSCCNLTIDPLQTAQAAPWGGLFSISALSARSGWR